MHSKGCNFSSRVTLVDTKIVNFVVPVNIHSILMRLWRSGGGGEYIERLVSVTPGDVFRVTLNGGVEKRDFSVVSAVDPRISLVVTGGKDGFKNFGGEGGTSIAGSQLSGSIVIPGQKGSTVARERKRLGGQGGGSFGSAGGLASLEPSNGQLYGGGGAGDSSYFCSNQSKFGQGASGQITFLFFQQSNM